MNLTAWRIVTADHSDDNALFWNAARAARDTCPEVGRALLDGATSVHVPLSVGRAIFVWAMRIEGFASALNIRQETDEERQFRASLIPLPCRTHPGTDAALSPGDWQYARSPAYEAAVRPVLPKGWELYSVIDADKPNPSRDYGATRLDGRAHVFGIRFSSGTPWRLHATFPRREDLPRGDSYFRPEKLVEACLWCDSRLGVTS